MITEELNETKLTEIYVMKTYFFYMQNVYGTEPLPPPPSHPDITGCYWMTFKEIC